jgi:hypothetical protein
MAASNETSNLALWLRVALMLTFLSVAALLGGIGFLLLIFYWTSVGIESFKWFAMSCICFSIVLLYAYGIWRFRSIALWKLSTAGLVSLAPIIYGAIIVMASGIKFPRVLLGG